MARIVVRFILAVILVGLCAPTARAGWLDWLNRREQSPIPSPTVASLSADEIARGLKEALAAGVQKAVANLGKQDGFLKNPDVKIPMPPKLADIEKGLRAIGQDKYADEFILTMNRAAEAAVPEAAAIFSDAITNLTVEDARKILDGPDDAATQYFRKVGEARLTEKMLPIVSHATAQAGVTASYKNLVGKAGFASVLFGSQELDIDQYITGEAMDGVFKMIAAEEKDIRKNPVARGTDLLKKVFAGVKVP